MKIHYTKIKTNIDWDRKVIDPYYDLVATDFVSKQDLDASHVLSVLLRNKRKQQFILPVYPS